MRSWFDKCFTTPARLRTALLTLVCISALLLLSKVWRQDLWSGYSELQSGSTLPEAGGAVLQWIADEQAEAGEDRPDDSSAISIVDTSTTPSAVVLPTTPAIVAAAMLPSDVAWMDELTDNYDIFPYIVTAENPDLRLSIPANKGREAMTYLSYLIDNYDKLPPYAIFIHGHRTAWHQDIDIMKMINDLRVDALREVGYVSFRCNWIPSCPAELRPIDHDAVIWGDGRHVADTEEAIVTAWPFLLPDVELPHTIASPCCAQFAVTRESMMRRSKEDYSRMRNWLLHTKLDDEVSGRVMEKLWALIMTGEAVHCPTPDTCACKYFGSCGFHYWPRPPEGLDSW